MEQPGFFLDKSQIESAIQTDAAQQLQRVIEERFGVSYHERTIGKLLKALGFSHISARPRHPKQDGEVIQAFKKTSPGRSQPTSRA